MADDPNTTATSDAAGNERATDQPSRGRTVLGFLSDWDRTMTSRLAVCSSPTASWGRVRPLMKSLECSGHALPWIGGVSIAMLLARSVEFRETFFNLLCLLLFDIAVLLLCKAVFQRQRPPQNFSDQTTLLSDKYSFPSGHATRAAAVAMFFIFRFDFRIASLLVIWSVCCCVSRVLLARHHVLDIVAGVAIGSLEYLVFSSYLWMSPESKIWRYLWI